MKSTALAALLLFFSIYTIAQTQIPAFGKIEKADLEMTACDFENNAEAEILFEVGEFYCTINYGMMSPLVIANEKRVRIKILKDKGLERANIHIPYFSLNDNEVVKGVSAQTYNLDATGNITISKLEKKSIYERKINKRYSELVFTLPEVKVGSVIEYKYTIDGSDNSQWYFQKSIPVLLSQYTVSFPYEMEMHCTPYCTLPLQSKKDLKGTREIQTFWMEKIPSLHDEAFITCDEDYLQRIETKLIAVSFPGSPRRSLTRSWEGIVKNLMEDEDFGMQLKRNIPRTSDLDLLLKEVNNPYTKMCIIHDYVKMNMQWNEYDNIWAVDGVKSAWKDKKGTSGEINLILVNLLKDAGLNAHPVLVSTHHHGLVNTFMPNVQQFNKVMAYLEIEKKKYVLDATEKNTPSKLIPFEVMTNEGLVIEKVETGEWGWKTLWHQDELFRNLVLINAGIDSNGVMKGEASVNSYDYARVERMQKLAAGKTAFMKDFNAALSPDLKVDSCSFDNEKVDTLPLVQNLQFNQLLNSSGDYKYFTVNLFSGLEKNPFIPDNRFSDVFFGYNQQISIIGNFNLPDNYVFEELPKNMRMIMPDTGIIFTRILGINDNNLSVRIDLEFKKPVYYVDEYPEFKEFYKKLFDLLNEQIVIRKKD